MFGLLVIIILIVFVSPISYLAANKLERIHSTPNINHSFNAKNIILVLGAGSTNDPHLSQTSKLSREVSSRLLEAVRLYSLIDSVYLVTSGAAVNSKIAQAQVVAEAAISLGISPDDTLHLSTTLNTEDEAREFKNCLGKLQERYSDKNFYIFLVTSALHMPRAVYWFHKYGIPVTPVPCDYQVKIDPDFSKSWWIPSFRKMTILNSVIYESFGLFYARYIAN